MGIAQLSNNETSEELYKRADAALYESKQTGRNKATIAANTVTKIKKIA
jgi:PleD family two-component response regulator